MNTMGYYVSCCECEFEKEMEGVDKIFEEQQEHQQRYDESHILEFEVKR